MKRVHTSRRSFLRTKVAAGLAVLGLLAGSYGVAAAATGSLTLADGNSETVSCGSSLSITNLAATSVTLNCATGTSTPPTTTPPSTTTPPTTQPTGSVWQVPMQDEFQWYLGGELNFGSTTIMGTGVTAYNGDTAPATNPTIYDVDGIENSAADVAKLHSMGDKAVCYVETGTAGNYYTAAQEGIPTTYYAQLSAAGDLGNSLAGYPEKFININSASAVSIVESMIQQQCSAKGFDGVETDLDETGGSNEGNTGFSISVAQNETYDETIAKYINSLNMAWFAKDLSDMDSQAFVSTLEPFAQALIDEQASQYGSISLDDVFLQNNKPVFDAEYSGQNTTASFCPNDNAANINGTLFNTALNGPRTPCR